MSKFNFKTYQKTNGDQHIDSKLQESHKSAPNEINEKQLESYRANEPTVLTEKQLEKNRAANKIKEATEITERQLDTQKGKFDNKLRNASAYEGDMSKLEEKRLKGSPVEDEKYEDASSTPQKFRWWEDVKSPDGLKVAQKKSVIQKNAQLTEELTFDRPKFEDALEDDDSPFEIVDEPSEIETSVNPVDSIKKEYEVEDFSDAEILPDFEIDNDTSQPSPMYVIKQKDILGDFSGVYMVLGYNAEEFTNDEMAIKQAALDKVLEDRPELKGIIDISDFGQIQENGAEGKITLRSVDPRLKSVLESQSSELEAPTEEISNEEVPTEENLFTELSYDVTDIGGTPMATGKIAVNREVTNQNEDLIIEDAIEYIQNTYNIEYIDKESLDLSNLEDGEIGFLIEAPQNMLSGVASTYFPIIEKTAQDSGSKKK